MRLTLELWWACRVRFSPVYRHFTAGRLGLEARIKPGYRPRPYPPLPWSLTYPSPRPNPGEGRYVARDWLTGIGPWQPSGTTSAGNAWSTSWSCTSRASCEHAVSLFLRANTERHKEWETEIRVALTVTPRSCAGGMYHVSCTMYHVPCIMYHVSCTMYHVSCTMQAVGSRTHTHISAYGTHKNLAIRKIMETMRTAYAKSRIRSQHVSNYT